MVATRIHSLLFNRHAWTPTAARTWAKMHGYSTRYYSAAAPSEEYFRFGQLATSRFRPDSFRTIKFGTESGIKAVIGKPKLATKRTPNPPPAGARARAGKVASIAIENPRPPVRHRNRSLNVPEVLALLGEALTLELTNGRVIDFGRGWLFTATETGRAIWLIKPDRKRLVKNPNRHLWVRKAESLYKRFTDFEPDGYHKAVFTDTSQSKFRMIGRVKSLSYRSDKWTGKAKGYIHTFKHPPSVWSNEDGAKNLLKVMGPKTRLTIRGIEG